MRNIMAESKRYEFTVSPKVTFLADQSDPDKNHFVFAYTITVTNTSKTAITARTIKKRRIGPPGFILGDGIRESLRQSRQFSRDA